MTEKDITLRDAANMRKLLITFPDQVAEATAIGKKADLHIAEKRISNIVLTGLGGSAIGGDLLRSYLADDLKIPFVVNRHYFLPEFVDKSSLVIVSSYSGNTEETIAAHEDAIRRKAQVLCICSNGETERIARLRRQSLIKIPRGFPPRAALGYSFYPLLVALTRFKLIRSREKDIRETIALLRRKARSYAMLNAKKNPALELAQRLYNKIPIVYSPAERFDAVNLRWRGQLCENSKVLAFGHVIPEMNHNELVGWKVLKRHMADMSVVFLHDRKMHSRVAVRMNITRTIVSEFAGQVIDIESEGTSLLARMFSLIYLGDWVSFYLAILNGVDPTPVRVIDYLKGELGKA